MNVFDPNHEPMFRICARVSLFVRTVERIECRKNCVLQVLFMSCFLGGRHVNNKHCLSKG